MREGAAVEAVPVLEAAIKDDAGSEALTKLAKSDRDEAIRKAAAGALHRISPNSDGDQDQRIRCDEDRCEGL